MQSSHGGTKDPTSQKTIRLYYQEAPNAIVSLAEERYLHLLEAVSQGDESRVKELLSMNASLLARDSRGATAGDLAAAKGHVNILRIIIETGVDVNINATDPWLHQALRNGHFTAAELLIKSGAKLLVRNPKGTNARGLEVAQLNILKKMVDAGVDVNFNKTDPWLHQALRNSQSTTAEFLIKSGAKLLVKDPKEKNARDLEIAQLDVLKKMVQAGVDVNVNKTDPWLHQALRNGHNTTAEFLIKSGANVNAKSSENQTAFEEAVLRGSVDAISLLHQSGADIHPGSGSQARLYQAIMHVNEPCLLLLCKTGVKIDSVPATPTGNEYFTTHSLKTAMSPGRAALIKLLLDYGAEVHSESSLDAILSLSESGGRLPVVELLTEYRGSVHEMPLGYKEPSTTVLSVINYDDDYIIQLLLEERAKPKERHLWERIVMRGRDGEKSCVFRLLHEWGPISTA